MEVLKVSSKSNPNSVAGALAVVVKEKGSSEIQSIGAGALNQAIKAIAIARGFLVPSGIDLVCTPSFTEVQIDGEERTAIKLMV
ncbi:MAG: stage V sporulation protein S, partial [Paraclostridium sp.]